MDLCRHIRWKSFYGRRNWTPEQVHAAAALNEEPTTCLSTQQPWGPDDAPCTLDRCGSGRACYEPSPRLRRAIS